MGLSTDKEFIEKMRKSAATGNPFDLESEESELKYDDKRLNDPEFCKRMAATIAKKYLIDKGIPFEEE